MNWTRFHHPDICMPVIRRQAGIEILELLEMTSLFLTRGGWALVNRHCYPNRSAFRNAASRLKGEGLVIKRKNDGSTPRLFLTNEGKNMLPDYFSPDRFWNRKWNGIWYMLIYDVPEKDRKYRNALRQFLKRKRMGCLQQSVWVTPQDIRPAFDDLSLAANVNAFAYLFEARTVLGLKGKYVADDAWNFDRLRDLQELYCDITRHNIARLAENDFEADELAALMRISLEAYHGAFIEDPLLPWSLCPDRYLGREVYALHKTMMARIAGQIATCHIS